MSITSRMWAQGDKGLGYRTFLTTTLVTSAGGTMAQSRLVDWVVRRSNEPIVRHDRNVVRRWVEHPPPDQSLGVAVVDKGEGVASVGNVECDACLDPKLGDPIGDWWTDNHTQFDAHESCPIDPFDSPLRLHVQSLEDATRRATRVSHTPNLDHRRRSPASSRTVTSRGHECETKGITRGAALANYVGSERASSCAPYYPKSDGSAWLWMGRGRRCFRRWSAGNGSRAT
jgi:hypothetical protein